MAKDGDNIRLPKGWTLHLDGSTREAGELQGFVTSPDKRESASLTFARSQGTTSGDTEQRIPPEVLAELDKEKYDQYE